VYARRYGEDVFTFEASGGLIQGSLIMNDDETGSYWSIMRGLAIAGSKAGQSMQELPGMEKTTWADWFARHPETQVLSVDGREHIPGSSPYANYFGSEEGFRGLSASDGRLPTKDSIYAFQIDERPIAVPHTAFFGGAALLVPEQAGSPARWVFLHRAPGASMFRSTSAWISSTGFERRGERWAETGSGAVFDAERGRWSETPGSELAPLQGFDTFWYVWSLAHPDTKVWIGRASAEEPQGR